MINDHTIILFLATVPNLDNSYFIYGFCMNLGIGLLTGSR